MKFTCTQSILKNNLSLVSRVIPSHPTHPILANFRFDAELETQTVTVTVFDLSLSIQVSFQADIEIEGSVTIPAKLLNDIVSRLPNGDLTLEAIVAEIEGEQEIAAISLISASGTYQLRGMSVVEYPELPEINVPDAIQLSMEELKQGLAGCLFATSSDDTKQMLTGVHLLTQQDSLEFAATDGHRLAVVKTVNSNQKADEDLELTLLELTLPARALREIERMLTMFKDNAFVNLYCHEGQAVLETEAKDYRLTSRTLEGTYPAYSQLIPKEFERIVTLDRRNLLNAVERIAVLADQKNNLVKFTIDATAQQLALSVEAQDVGSGKEMLKAQISGDNLEIAFNVKYLIEGLKALPSSEILMNLNSATSPVTFTTAGESKMTYLIMPVQLRD